MASTANCCPKTLVAGIPSDGVEISMPSSRTVDCCGFVPPMERGAAPNHGSATRRLGCDCIAPLRQLRRSVAAALSGFDGSIDSLLHTSQGHIDPGDNSARRVRNRSRYGAAGELSETDRGAHEHT